MGSRAQPTNSSPSSEVGADTPPGGSNGSFQSLAIETALVPIQSELAEIRRQINDQGRQTSKDEIVFEGTALRPLENETERQTLQRVVKTHWGLDLKGFEDSHVDEVKQVHWLPTENQEKKVLLAKFLNLSKGSNFHKILHTRPELSTPGVTLYRRLHQQTKNDKRLSFIARKMKEAKEITKFVFDSVSGRLKVTFPGDETRQTFSEASDLLARCSPALVSQIAALDKKRKRRSGPKGLRSPRK